jgi:nitrate/nitrite transport system ATP-binding protein
MNLHGVKNDRKASILPFTAVGAHLPPLIELHEVEKSFPGRVQPVLTRLSFSISEGDFAVIVGGSGAGKTTLISLLAGLLTPDHGEIRFAGKPLSGPGPERAVVFQNYSLLPWLTVLENVSLAVTAASPQFNRRTVHDHAQYFIDLVNLDAAVNKRPRELSGGMCQRVALARALAMEPRLLLLDEPLSALDALTRATLQDELARICSETKTTVIMVTNDIDEAILLADRVYPLTRGPAATLGHPITSALLRPRSRHGISLDPAYQEARQHIMTFLEQSKKASALIKTATPAAGLRTASTNSQTGSPPLTPRMQSL